MLHILFLGVHLEELAVIVLLKQIFWSHSVQVSSIDLQEVNELLILCQQDLEHIFYIVLVCYCELLLCGLPGWLLT